MEQQTTFTSADDISRENTGAEGRRGSDAEIRALQDLELVLVSGGNDSAPVWP